MCACVHVCAWVHVCAQLGEDSLSVRSMHDARLLLPLYFLLLEQRAAAAMAATQLREAALDLRTLQHLLAAFPTQLASMVPGAHMLAGECRCRLQLQGWVNW